VVVADLGPFPLGGGEQLVGDRLELGAGVAAEGQGQRPLVGGDPAHLDVSREQHDRGAGLARPGRRQDQ
jgi:hypothetical protein